MEWTFLPEEQIAHGGVAHHDHFVDGLRIDGELFDGVAEVTGERAHQQPAGMLSIVGDARHDFRAAEALRILKRSVGDQFAGFKIDEAQDDRGGAQVHGDAVDGAGGAIHFYAVDQDAVAIARDCGIELQRALLPGSPSACRSMRMWPRRMVWQRTWPAVGGNAAWHERRKLPLRCAPARSAPREHPSLRRPRPCTPCTCPAFGRKWARRCPSASA